MASNESSNGAEFQDSGRCCSLGHGDKVPIPGFRSYGATDLGSGASISTFPTEASDIPPADHGIDAWLFLFRVFLIEGLIWGLPFSYGVFEKYYAEHEPFSSQPGIAAIGTTGLGVAYFVSPVIVVVLQKWPSQRRNISIFGLIMITIGLVAASFTDRVVHLIIIQGVLYGIGGSLLYNPFLFYLNEWFIERKGLAYGVFWAGTGAFGAVVPLIMDWGLDRFGVRTTLRAWAVFVFCTLAFLIYFTRPRLPVPTSGRTAPLKLGFLRTPLFWIFQLGNIIQGFGHFMPQIYLPTYSESIGLSPLAATLSLSLINIASTIGPMFIGALIDRYHITTVLLISAMGSAISVFFIWGLSTAEPAVYVFTLVFGIFAGGYTATWTGCATQIQKRCPESEVAMVIGIMAAGRGVGCMLGGPVSEKLLSFGVWQGAFQGAYGTKYGSLIIFTGVTAVFGGLGVTTRTRARKGGHSDFDNRPEETDQLIGH